MKIKLWKIHWQSKKYSGDYGEIVVNASNSILAIKKAIRKYYLVLSEIDSIELLGIES